MSGAGSRMRTAGLAVGLLAVGALAVVAGLRALGGEPDMPLYEVGRGRFLHRVEAEGVLQAETATVLSTPLGAQGPMRIAWIASDGSAVEEGQVVVRFDPTDMEKELFDGEADRAKAERQADQKEHEQHAVLENLERDAYIAELQLEHAQEFQTVDEEIYSRTEIIESQIDETLALERREHAESMREIRGELGDVELDLLGIERNRAQLVIDKAQAGLRELEVRAPHDGILVLQRDWSGETPTVGQMTWSGQPLAEIPRLERMKALVYVLEADAGGLEAGMPARVILEAHPGRLVEATVRRVSAVAKRRARWSPVQYFDVDLELASTDPELMKPGQRVRATILLQDLDDVIAVPREAVFRDADGNPFVYVLRGGGFETVDVTTGPAALGRVVIEQGLQEGDVISLQDPSRSAAPAAEPDAEPSGPGIGPTGRGR